MPNSYESYESRIDEYMWPLTAESASFNWSALSEELEIRTRLGVILAHVRDMYIAPRLRRLGPHPSPERLRATQESVISGPTDGPLWQQTLHEPVPRALRDEWRELTRRLGEIKQAAVPSVTGNR